MKKTLISLALITCASQSIASEIYNGRISAMGGAGYVTAKYSDGLLYNPSLAADYGKDDDFALAFNMGVLIDDSDELVDGMNNLVDYTDYLRGIQDYQDLSQTNIDELKRLMGKVDGDTAQVSFGGSLVAAIPNSLVSMALVAKVSGQVALTPNIDANDYNLINNSLNTPFSPDDLQSSTTGTGVAIGEFGIALAKEFTLSESAKLLVGITPKRQEVKTIVYEAQVATYNEDNIDGDQYTVTTNTTNFDAGLTYITGDLRYGLSINNFSDKTFKTIDGESVDVKRRMTAAIGYSKDWIKTELAMDLNATPAFGLNGDTKLLHAGLELAPISWLQLRAGLQRDMENTLPDTYSFGLGLSPFDVVNIDLAYLTGDKNTEGAAIQLGLRF